MKLITIYESLQGMQAEAGKHWMTLRLDQNGDELEGD